jgi:SiaC family regulatory phosphoprotein
MENLIIEGSPKTPEVNFNFEKGSLELKGRSIPENSVEFYQPLNEWIDNYGSGPNDKTVIDIKLEYFNTSSSKCILDIFKKLESINGVKTEVSVNWYFEQDDEDMEEAGQDYQAIIGLPFNMVEVEEI